MNLFKSKAGWLSILALAIGYPVLAPQRTMGQERGERGRAIQSRPAQPPTPNLNQKDQNRDRSGDMNRNGNRNERESRRWNNDRRSNNGFSGDRGRWNNDSGRWRNNFNNDRNRNWDRDRDRDREGRRGRDRDHHRDRDRSSFNLGLFWGAPYTNYYGDPGYYYSDPGYYPAAPYSSYAGSPYDAGYADGFEAGQLDRNQGAYYNPRQYERSGDPDYFEGFVAGYQDGYRR